VSGTTSPTTPFPITVHLHSGAAEALVIVAFVAIVFLLNRAADLKVAMGDEFTIDRWRTDLLSSQS
jgi:hypothetical protein